jgi:DNA modification methylase
MRSLALARASDILSGSQRSRCLTSTSNFGASRRESHDARAFYGRFPAPEMSDDQEVNPCPAGDSLFLGDSRKMAQVPDKSVALVCTSPAYFSGKQYEEELGRGHIPATYVDYLEQLKDVFAECRRVLEPGGRMAINVANLGRKPYRSLSADIITILQDELGFLLRGEIIWQKGVGASGNCAWGSFMRPSNPVLRDLTERVIVASKGRFDRAPNAKRRAELGLPHEATIQKEEFMAWTLDVWQIQPESATRVGHPAPFPIELPPRLIELYTYRGDVVLDPFMGSGTTAVACVGTDRRYVGYDADASYLELAERRIADARQRRDESAA